MKINPVALAGTSKMVVQFVILLGVEDKGTQDAACTSLILRNELKSSPFILTALAISQNGAAKTQIFELPLLVSLKPHRYKTLFGLLSFAFDFQYVAEVFSRKEACQRTSPTCITSPMDLG